MVQPELHMPVGSEFLHAGSPGVTISLIIMNKIRLIEIIVKNK